MNDNMPVKTATTQPTATNSVSTTNDKKNQGITQTRQQLQDKLSNVQSTNRELIADIKEIARLIKSFKDTVGFPDSVNIMWVISNRKAIMKLLQDIIKVLKNKNNSLGLGI